MMNESAAYACLRIIGSAPQLKKLCASREVGFPTDWNNRLETLEIIIGGPHPHTEYRVDWYESYSACQEHSVKRIKSQDALEWLKLCGARDDEENPGFSIDPLLQYLEVKLIRSLKCPSLSQLYLSKEQNYSCQVLAECLLSRRLASNFPALPGQSTFYSCSRLTLFLEKSKMEEFREEEDKILAGSAEWIREAGRAEVKDLGEWED